MNISAVLRDIGLPYIWGYKPYANLQAELSAEVERFLAGEPDILLLLEEAVLSDTPGQPGDSARADAERLLETLRASSAVVGVEANRTESTQ